MNDYETEVRGIIREMLERLQRGEPVTQDLLARIPEGTRIEMPVTVSGKDGTRTERGTLLIEKGAVTFHLAGERPN